MSTLGKLHALRWDSPKTNDLRVRGGGGGGGTVYSFECDFYGMFSLIPTDIKAILVRIAYTIAIEQGKFNFAMIKDFR